MTKPSIHIPQAHAVQYADDTQISVSGKTESLLQLIATMEQNLSTLIFVSRVDNFIFILESVILHELFS